MLNTEDNYPSVKAFIYGLLIGLDVANEMSKWYNKRIRKDSSSIWTWYIESRNKDKTDEELKSILIKSVEDFVNEHPHFFDAE